ncbi:C2 domain-containing protein 5 isoform X1 [Adelges cooleyi]|uniref:C2 domain-containing protein 5 isoform X1 n=1 Tax=Adelges cooleyi TaxID=133065 RepID=UPI00217FE4A8|nr:C2 domain-containing protein 5 isoform X1 [Adelges cooleyi]XP_050437384.1 C2 domain-containing protein 5 isoform X1 [Adelges cooleyi]XP_050437385.1 C2 domain-containing protein 5 isoform X1 [Adelges cooleyi]
MPGKVKVRVLAGRNLPVMDRSSDTTDAYVEVKLGSTTYKTDVCRKSLNPQWNSEWYKFELDDTELQDEPLQIRIMDHDTYSANDAIGKVYFNLNPLLLPQPTVVQLSGQQTLAETLISNQSQTTGGSVVSGWFPVFDTMHGIRGEVHIIIKVELFSDFNRFRQSSCGIQFFYSGAGITAHTEWVHGFVEELVVEDDPEYQWLDKLRTPRATNEARQTIFLKLSNEVQRRIGLKVLELGANAVIGYNQYFDLEGESGIVVRGIGTAVTLVRHLTLPSVNLNVPSTIDDLDFPNYLSSIDNNNCTSTLINNSINSCPIRKVSPNILKSNTVDFAELSSMKSLFDQEDRRKSKVKRQNRFLKAFQNTQHKLKKKHKYSASVESASSSSDHDRHYNTCNSALGFLAQATLEINSSFEMPSESDETHAQTFKRQLVRQPSVETQASKLSLEYLFHRDAQGFQKDGNKLPDIVLPSSSSLNSNSDSTAESEVAIGFDSSDLNVRDLSPGISDNPTYYSDSSGSEDHDSLDLVSTNSESLSHTPPLSRIVTKDRPETPPLSKIVYLSHTKSSFLSPLTDMSRSVSPYNSSSFSNSQSTVLHSTPPPTVVSNNDVECTINNEPSLIEPEENVCSAFSDIITASECSPHASNCDDRNGEMAESPVKVAHLQMHRRSSDSEISSVQKGTSLTGSCGSTSSSHRVHGHAMFHRSILSKDTLDAMEYPFLTMTKYPPGFIVHIGGMVNAKSVKLLERMSNMEEPESRDSWWSELRLEMRSHARALSCNVVLGYTEHTAICDDVCVLSAMGTAAVVNLIPSVNPSGYFAGIYPSAPLAEIPEPKATNTHSCSNRLHKHSVSGSHEKLDTTCSVCHIPYNELNVPFSMNMKYCSCCKRHKVPHILLSSLEPMERLSIIGTGTLLQTFVCRTKRDLKGEMNAKEISDGLPFLEYELHSQLLNKLRVKGMNAIFGLKVQVCLGERVVSLHATGTAMYVACLPEPPLPLVKAGKSWAHPDQQQVLRTQKLLNDAVINNRSHYHLNQKEEEHEKTSSNTFGKTLPDLNLGYGNRDTCILEMDDAEDVDVVTQLLEPTPPSSFLLSNTDVLPGTGSEVFPMEPVCNLQMFTQVWRSKAHYTNGNFDKQLQRMLQGLFFKLRRMTPCGLGKLSFKIDIPELDELQISIVGMALGLGESDKTTAKQILRRRQLPIKDFDQKAEELIFKLEEELPISLGEKKVRKFERAPRQSRLSTHAAPKDRYGVDITPMTYIPGAKIERYLGNLNFFFIRESTCIRESGGLSGFVHCFVAEVMAIVRAHVTALGGNAMVAYFMNECILLNNPHKNQGQCLLNVGGDVVEVSYYNDD